MEILFILLLGYLVFASIQDFRTTEISDWLTFSLIGFALAFKAGTDVSGLLFHFGILSVIFFTAIGYILYYGRAFAGGDAKLLVAVGSALPIASYSDLLYYGFGYVIALFAFGTLWSVGYVSVISFKDRTHFARNFHATYVKNKRFIHALWIISVPVFIALAYFDSMIALFAFAMMVLVPFLLIGARVVERISFIKLVSPGNLMEGDWIVHKVRIGKEVILPDVAGLSKEQIALLKKRNRPVLVKGGVPFGPAFLFATVAFLIYYRIY